MGKTGSRFVLAATLLLFGVSPAAAQWSWGVYGAGEFDTEDVVFVGAGLRVAPTTSWSWSPVFGVQGFWLQIPAGEDDTSITALTPSVGLQRSFNDGAFGIHAGYQFQNEDVAGATTTSATVGEGAVAMADLNWGASRPVAVQLLGSYNFGADAFWGRARSTLRVATISPGALRLGAEVAHMNQSDDADTTFDDGFSSTAIGPVLEWHTGRGVTLGAAAGRKLQEGDDATYFRFEMSLFP